MTANPRHGGRVITFYSYKGGCGRSMALANVACLIAQRPDTSVLMLDWDLEAPGLHRYFPERWTTSGSRRQPTTDDAPGLIDFFGIVERAVDSDGRWQSPEAAATLVEEVDPARFVQQTSQERLDIMTAGSLDAEYGERIARMDWRGLFERCSYVFSAFAHHLARRYTHVLIDARTGHTDIAGICTALMPDRLVAVFSPNRQSLIGSLEVAARAASYRQSSSDERPLVIFPLPSRIEMAEPDLFREWRFGTASGTFAGYQRLYQDMCRETYGLTDCDLTEYFDEVQIQHVPRYAYGEEVAVLVEHRNVRLSLARSFDAFCERLQQQQAPWHSHVDRAPADEFVEVIATLEVQAENSLAEGNYARAAELFTVVVAYRRRLHFSVAEETVDAQRRLAAALLKLGEAYAHLGRNDDALKVATEARWLSEAARDPEGLLSANQTLANIHYQASEFTKADAFVAQRYDALVESADDRPALIATIRQRVLNALGNNDVATATKWLHQAQQVAGDDAPLRGAVLEIEALLAAHREQWPEAERLYRAVLEGATPDSAQAADLALALGRVLVAQDRGEEAIVLFQSTVTIRERPPSHGPALAQAQISQGLTLMILGRYAEAGRLFESALHVLEHGLGERHRDVLEVLTALSMAQLAAGNWEAAKSFLRRAVTIQAAQSQASAPAQTSGQGSADVPAPIDFVAQVLRQLSDSAPQVVAQIPTLIDLLMKGGVGQDEPPRKA